MRISDWSSDVCSSDLLIAGKHQLLARACRNIYGADFLHIYDLYRVERRGKAPVNARPHGSGVATKPRQHAALLRSEEHTSELQSLMRISYAVFCLKNKKINLSRRPYTSHKN